MPRQRHRWISSAPLILFFLPIVLALAGFSTVVLADSCLDCHKDPKFRVTNKKLHDYYQDWKPSVHAQEGVSCSDCHGGNPKLGSKKAAHGSAKINPSKSASPVHFRNIPATCASCHEEFYEHFRKSKHFKKLQQSGAKQSGPNCVTCHASVNTTVLNVNTVRDACSFCHNKEKDNNPDIPAKAERLLNKFLSIHRFYRYLTIRGEFDPKVYQTIDERTQELFVDWHSFDLPVIEAQTDELLEYLKTQRDQVRARRKKKKS